MKRLFRLFNISVTVASLSMAVAFGLEGLPLASLAAIGLGAGWALPGLLNRKRFPRMSELAPGNLWLVCFGIAAVICALLGGTTFWFGLAAMLSAIAAWDLQAFIQRNSTADSMKFQSSPIKTDTRWDADSEPTKIRMTLLESEHLHVLGIVLSLSAGLVVILFVAGRFFPRVAPLGLELTLGVLLVLGIIWLGRIFLHSSENE